jgi:hypothetical protein
MNSYDSGPRSLEVEDGDSTADALGTDHSSRFHMTTDDDHHAGRSSTRSREFSSHLDSGTDKSLEPVRFAKVLFQCWSKRVSGALHVMREQETLTIYFRDGAAVQIESDIAGDSLGRALVYKGRIGDDEYSAAAKHAIESGCRLGRSLVDLKFLTADELNRELASIAKEQIIGCLAARSGGFAFDQDKRPPEGERSFVIPMGTILAEGIGKHFDDVALGEVIPDVERRYFRLFRPIAEVTRDYSLSKEEQEFLSFSGRAYNVVDAAEVSRLPRTRACTLMALLVTCEEVSDFTPGVNEFEARLREERDRRVEDEPVLVTPPQPAPAPLSARARPMSAETNVIAMPGHSPDPIEHDADSHAVPLHEVSPDTAVKPILTMAAQASPVEPTESRVTPSDVSQLRSRLSRRLPPSQTSRAAAGRTFVAASPSSPQSIPPAIPPMPAAAPDAATRVPDSIQFAPSGGSSEPQEVSREYFQRGVTLLTQGHYDAAESAFRDAISLCSEEHVSPVYLVGLGRSIYYNPGYTRDGKLPLLSGIVHRTKQLAPQDHRVMTLASWVESAEQEG